MNIDELKRQLQEDLGLNMDELDAESLRIPTLHGKWLGFALDVQGKLIRLKGKMRQLQLKKRNFYMGRGTAEEYRKNPWNMKVLKSEVQTYIDADSEVIKLRDVIEVNMALLQFLEGAVKAVTNKQWNIRNAIEFAKFKNGVV